MGLWYKENFPNSPAAKQRLLVARAGIFYTLVVGTAVFMFSPFMNRLRKRLSEGEELVEWEYFRDRRSIERIPGMEPGVGTPRLDHFFAARKRQEVLERDDADGPKASDALIRTRLR